MENVLAKIDKLLCSYLGLNKVEITPHFVSRNNKGLTILNTESFKRHAQETSLSEININMMNNENKEKLGIAIGKAIANNLIISFDQIAIKREDSHAR